MGEGPPPLDYRQYLLARELGADYVARIRSWAQFERLWQLYLIQHLAESGEEGQKTLKLRVAVRKSDQYAQEAQDEPPPVIDFDTASPEQVKRWMAKYAS